MAALALPFIELVATRVLIALGVIATGAAASDAIEQARKRQEEAEQAKSSPIAKTDAKTKEQERCKECPPNQGKPFQRNFPERKPWVDYQVRIGGMSNGATFIIEWDIGGVRFDGFVSAECLLKEAKAAYDQFFDEYGRPKRWWVHNINEMMREISSQSIAASPRPPVRLEWFWQQPISHRYFSSLLRRIAPDIPHHYEP
ncbi:hypothetical protein HNQ59_001591 [Chitinivorax tropicus]|uniref:Tox-REase-5 domain-containing protein n=1 Tax=Chitinivorax tropicus TaxID=714531 RepID=A0A840MQ50_9PROT|nr:Tox-REase-5 domain-containing protein [Chitinivorax tropicus]MBB5018303.1 hypothetical protein [Chitinivorax tropicus]